MSTSQQPPKLTSFSYWISNMARELPRSCITDSACFSSSSLFTVRCKSKYKCEEILINTGQFSQWDGGRGINSTVNNYFLKKHISENVLRYSYRATNVNIIWLSWRKARCECNYYLEPMGYSENLSWKRKDLCNLLKHQWNSRLWLHKVSLGTFTDDGEVTMQAYWLWPAEILQALLQTSTEIHGTKKGTDRFPNSTNAVHFRMINDTNIKTGFKKAFFYFTSHSSHLPLSPFMPLHFNGFYETYGDRSFY